MANKVKLNIFDIAILVFYGLFTGLLGLSLAGLFNRLTVLIVIVLGVFSVLAMIKFKGVALGEKKPLWLFVIVPFISAGFGLLRGFFTGDTYSVWLPAGRFLFLEGKFPDFISGWAFSGMPFLSLLFGLTFTIFGKANEFFCLWIPFFFTSATIILAWRWAKEKGVDGEWLIFIPLLFLSNHMLEFFGGWNLMQEAPVLFFSTAFFYYYEKHLENFRKKDLLLALMSLILACASKISGFFLVPMLFFIFIRSKWKKELLSYSLLVAIPIVLWLVRGYWLFENPFYPAFSNIFGGKMATISRSYLSFALIPEGTATLIDKFRVALNYFLLSFPMIFVACCGFVKKRRYDWLFFVVSYFLIKEMFLFTPSLSSARYYYLILGLLIVYGLFGLQALKNRLWLSALLLIALWGLLTLPVVNSSSAFISRLESVAGFVGSLAVWVSAHNVWILLLLSPAIWFVTAKKQIKVILIGLYCLYILHLQFVAQKSWLATWPFLFAFMLLSVIVLSIPKLEKYTKMLVVVFVLPMLIWDSWGMALTYYKQEGSIALPVPFVYENSRWARGILDADSRGNDKKDFYIVIADQRDYFNWWTEYRALHIFNFDFLTICDDYHSGMSGGELYDYLKSKKIKYIVKNIDSIGIVGGKEFRPFFDTIDGSSLFVMLAQKQGRYKVWRVY